MGWNWTAVPRGDLSRVECTTVVHAHHAVERESSFGARNEVVVRGATVSVKPTFVPKTPVLRGETDRAFWDSTIFPLKVEMAS